MQSKVDSFGTSYSLSKINEKNPIVFIHGVGLTKEIWEPQINFLKDYNTLTYDLLGHGKTPLNKSKVNFDDFSKQLFKLICKKLIVTSILEAELIKLFSNAWRYINFSISNQFYMMCKERGLNFSKIRNLMRDKYERNLNLPTAGFTAGPCLLKDTMQLSSFYKNYLDPHVFQKLIISLIVFQMVTYIYYLVFLNL